MLTHMMYDLHGVDFCSWRSFRFDVTDFLMTIVFTCQIGDFGTFFHGIFFPLFLQSTATILRLFTQHEHTRPWTTEIRVSDDCYAAPRSLNIAAFFLW